jgi:hypothetical protein
MPGGSGAKSTAFLSFSLVVILAGCATGPRLPEWAQEPARIVDEGYIVYLGDGLEADPNQAQFAAEGMAIQDLANECSFVPKRARIENHFMTRARGGFEAYATIAVNYDVCEEAQQTVQPAQIKALASAPFMEELKRYQEFIGNPPQQAPAGGASQGPPEPPTAMADDVDFFLARQYVAVQKENVILAPPGAYAPGSYETRTYLTRVTRVIRPMQAYYARHPRLRAAPTTWSTIEPRVRRRYPAAFKGPVRRVRLYRAPRRRWFRRRPLRPQYANRARRRF